MFKLLKYASLVSIWSGFQLEGLYEGWKKGNRIVSCEIMCLLSLTKFGDIVFLMVDLIGDIYLHICAGQERRDSTAKVEDRRSQQILCSKTSETWLGRRMIICHWISLFNFFARESFCWVGLVLVSSHIIEIQSTQSVVVILVCCMQIPAY